MNNKERRAYRKGFDAGARFVIEHEHMHAEFRAQWNKAMDTVVGEQLKRAGITPLEPEQKFGTGSMF